MIDNNPYYRCQCGGSEFLIQQTFNVKQAEDAIPEPTGNKRYVCASCGAGQQKKVNEQPKKTIY